MLAGSIWWHPCAASFPCGLIKVLARCIIHPVTSVSFTGWRQLDMNQKEKKLTTAQEAGLLHLLLWNKTLSRSLTEHAACRKMQFPAFLTWTQGVDKWWPFPSRGKNQRYSLNKKPREAHIWSARGIEFKNICSWQELDPRRPVRSESLYRLSYQQLLHLLHLFGECRSPCIVRIVKCRWLRWAAHVARMGKTKDWIQNSGGETFWIILAWKIRK
jgi:hypothetical protein